MTVDVPDPRVPILVKRLGKKKAEKSGVIMLPDTANEKLEEFLGVHSALRDWGSRHCLRA